VLICVDFSVSLIVRVGEGGFGIVYKVKEKNQILAVKKVPYALTGNLEEFKIQEFLLHPNITKVFEVFLDSQGIILLLSPRLTAEKWI
jgi:serine/threonine protein kinase